MKAKVQKRLGAQKYEKKEIHVSVGKITQKIAIRLPENQSVFIIQKSYFICDMNKLDNGYDIL